MRVPAGCQEGATDGLRGLQSPLTPTTLPADRADMGRACRWLITALLVWWPATGAAQTVEVAPFGGYRFGGDLFEVAVGRELDSDGAATAGAVVDVAVAGDSWFEVVVSHQWARVSVPADAFGPAERVDVAASHWLAGGRQDFGAGRARLFLTGLLGLTWYAADDDAEIRFAVSAGGGVRWPLQRRVGLRLDARAFTTFVDVDGDASACGSRGCLVGVDVDVVWQFECTAGLVFAF